jgi:hypothetical protein
VRQFFNDLRVRDFACKSAGNHAATTRRKKLDAIDRAATAFNGSVGRGEREFRLSSIG